MQKRPVLTRPFPVLLTILVLALPAAAQWQSVAPGIEYAQFNLPDPNRLFVTRMDRANTDCIIESAIGSGELRDGRETVSGMATRCEDSINYWSQNWGNRSHVVAAINGDYFNLTTGVPTSGQIQSGWQARRFMEYSGGSGFVWKMDRTCFIGGNVRNATAFDEQRIYFPDGSYMVPTRVNEARSTTNEMVLYTSHYADQTYTDNTGMEVLVEMARPLLELPHSVSSYVSGTVREIRLAAGSTPIPFDHVVLSAVGATAAQLQSKISVGAELKFKFQIEDYGTEGQVPTPPSDWTKAYASIGGAGYVVKNGIVPSADWADNSGAIIRAPRTAVAFNSTYVFFIVCDGRSVQSAGMTFTEVGEFCVNYLSATQAITQDGGGSSALWVNGQIKNVPSDGSERPVANGLFMVNVRARELSPTFRAGDLVQTTVPTTARLGPGTNYETVGSQLATGTTGTVATHAMDGVKATGKWWWKCTLGTTTGWLDETALALLQHRVPDFDADGDVDQDDYGHFQMCISGPAISQTDADCINARLDYDDDVDSADFTIFLNCFRGPDVPYLAGCAD